MEKYSLLRTLNTRLYFTVADVVSLTDIKPGSARVLCSRYAKEGVLVRLKNNFYLTEQKWENMDKDGFLKIANFLQVPSYVSFMTALSFYEVTTQVQRNFFENASLKRTLRMDVREAVFCYYKLKKELYFDFVKEGDIFIALKEKAFMDAVYLYSFGKYKLDFSSLDLGKLDKKIIKTICRKFPEKTQAAAKKLCGI